MTEDMTLTIDNWRSEYKRLQIRYKRLSDPSSAEGRGLLDHMQAVKQILADLGDNNNNPEEKA